MSKQAAGPSVMRVFFLFFFVVCLCLSFSLSGQNEGEGGSSGTQMNEDDIVHATLLQRWKSN